MDFGDITVDVRITQDSIQNLVIAGIIIIVIASVINGLIQKVIS